MSTSTTTRTIPPVEHLGVRRLVAWSAVRVRENPVLVGLFLLAGVVGYVPFVGGLLAFLATVFVVGAAYVLLADELAGESRDVGDVATDVRERFLTLVLVGLAYAVAVLLGLILLVIPGLYVAVRLSPALTVATLDGKDVGDSLREGWALGKGNVLRLGGVFLVVFVLQAVAAGVLGLVGGPDLAASGLSTVVLNAVSGPITAAAVAHVYFESRDGDAVDTIEEPTADAAV